MYITARAEKQNGKAIMDRREFLSILGTSASIRLAGKEEETSPIGDDIYPDLVKVAERAAEESLPKQQTDGGLRDEHEIPQPGATAGFLCNLAALFLAQSRFLIFQGSFKSGEFGIFQARSLF